MSEEQHEILKEQIMLYSKSIEIHAGRMVRFTKQDLDRLGFLNVELDRRLKLLDKIVKNRRLLTDVIDEYYISEEMPEVIGKENNSDG